MEQKVNMAVDCDQSLMDASRDNYVAAKERFLLEFNRAKEDLADEKPSKSAAKLICLIINFCISDVVKKFIYNGNPKEIANEAQWIYDYRGLLLNRNSVHEGFNLIWFCKRHKILIIFSFFLFAFLGVKGFLFTISKLYSDYVPYSGLGILAYEFEAFVIILLTIATILTCIIAKFFLRLCGYKFYLSKLKKELVNSIDVIKSKEVFKPYTINVNITKDSSVEYFEEELDKRYYVFIDAIIPFFDVLTSRSLFIIFNKISRENLTVLLGQCEECWQKLEKYCQVIADDEVFIKDSINRIYELREEEKAKERERKQRAKEEHERNLRNRRERERAAEQERLDKELKILRAEEEENWQIRKVELLESISSDYYRIEGEIEEKRAVIKVLSKKVDEIAENGKSLNNSINEFNKLIKKIKAKIDAINVELSREDISIDENAACLKDLKKYSKKVVDLENDLVFFKDNLRKNEAMYEDKKHELDYNIGRIRVLNLKRQLLSRKYHTASNEEFVFDEEQALLTLKKSINAKKNSSSGYTPYSNYNGQGAGYYDDYDEDDEDFDRDVFDEEDLYNRGKSYDDEVLGMVLDDEFDREMAESLGIDSDFGYYNASFDVGGYDGPGGFFGDDE